MNKILLLERALANRKGGAATKHTKSDAAEIQANDHMLDDFYVDFEKRFRGSEDDIRTRQEFYIPILEGISKDKKHLPIVDIGCGRGEFVELLTESGFTALGLDLNATMIKEVEAKGLHAVQENAIDYLLNQPPESILAITGFHIVEHIPFEQLIRLFEACYSALCPGGIVIFETPNPENVIVGSCNFYSDPSHLHPIPPPVLAFTLESRGFIQTDILRLHPMIENFSNEDPLVLEIATKMFGPQDYSVVATK